MISYLLIDVQNYGHSFPIKFQTREALEEIPAGVIGDARLNHEHAGDICLYYIHDY